MRASSHLAIGLSTYLCLNNLAGQHPPVLCLAACACGIIAVDLDHPLSRIGRMPVFNLIAEVISAVFGHRTILHSGVALALLLLMTIWFRMNPIMLAFTYGYLTHLLCDTTTHMGVPWLYGYSRFKFTTNWFYTGSVQETIVAIIITATSFALIGINNWL